MVGASQRRNEMQTIRETFWQNGRFDTQRASVTLWDDGRYTFCDGHGDPWACKSLDDALTRMDDYLADKLIVAKPYWA
jgi:hypothetical protein